MAARPGGGAAGVASLSLKATQQNTRLSALQLSTYAAFSSAFAMNFFESCVPDNRASVKVKLKGIAVRVPDIFN